MATKFRVPRAAFPNIAAIIKNVDKLPLLKASADELEPNRCTPDRISSTFAAKADLSLAVAQQIVTQIMQFHGLRANFGMTPSQLYDATTESLSADGDAEWKRQNLDDWKSAKDAIIKVLEPGHPFNVVQKRTRLSYEHQNVLFDSSIVTDIRPIFDDTAREILQLSITHVLEVDYFDGDRRNQLFATLDSADVAKLKSWCERAQTKEATLKTKLKSVPWPIVIPGTDDD